MTLWNLKRYEVEDIMKDFVRKSMAVEEYDSTRKTYVYSVHDLQLDYLKYQLLSDSRNEVELHQRLLARYEEVCNQEYHKLPDDGYIYFYLGYHIYKSGEHHLFPKVYLDLQYIGEKIRVTGPADLLVDIKKYFDFIVSDVMGKLLVFYEYSLKRYLILYIYEAVTFINRKRNDLNLWKRFRLLLSWKGQKFMDNWMLILFKSHFRHLIYMESMNGQGNLLNRLPIDYTSNGCTNF